MAMTKVGGRIVLEGEKEYKSAVTSASRATVQFKNEMKLVETQTALSGKSLSSLQQRTDALTKVLDAQAAKQDAVSAGLEHARADYAQVGEKLETYKSQLAAAKTELDRMTKSGDASEQEISEQKRAVEQLTERVNLGERAYATAGKRVENWEGQLQKASLETRTTAAELDNLGTRIKKASAEAENAKFEQMASSLERTGSAVESVGKKLSIVSAASAAAVVSSVKLATTFEDAMAKVSTIADTSRVSMDQLSSDIMQLSDDVNIYSETVAEAVYDSISAGRDTADAVEYVGDSAKLAKAGFAELNDSLSVMSTILNAYKLEASEAGAVSDRLINTQNRGRTTVAQLAQSMGSVIPTAAAFNVNLDNLATAYVVMTKNGIATAEATTYISGMLNELGKAGTTASDIIVNKTGKSFSQLMEEGWTLYEVLDLVQTNAKNSGLSMADMFGNIRAGKAALTLTNDGGKEFAATLRSMGEVAGATDEAFRKVTDTTSEKFAASLNRVRNAGITAGQTLLIEFAPQIEQVTEAVTDAAKWFGNLSEGEKETAAKAALVVAAIGPVTTALGTVIKSGGEVVRTYQKISGAVSEYNGVMGLLNHTMLANPAVLVGGAIVGLSAVMVKARSDALASNVALQEIKTTGEQLTESLSGATNSVRAAMDAASDGVDKVIAQGNISDKLISDLEELESQSSLTAEEQSRMAVIVSELNNLYPDLGIAIDEVSGKTNLGAASVREYADSWLEAAKAEAYMEAAKEGVSALIEAETALQEAKTSGREIDEKVSELERQLAEAREKAAEASGRAATSAVNETAETIALANALQEAKAEQTEVKEAVSAAAEAYESAQGQIDYYSRKAQELSGSLDSAAASTDSLTESQQAMAENAGASIEVAGEELAAYDALDQGLQTVATSVANSVNTMRENVSEAIASQISMFDEFNAGTAMSTEQMLANMQSQIDGITQWEQNLAELADKGINQDLLQHLADMGPSGAAYVQTFNSMTSEELAQAGGLWQESLDIQGFQNEAGEQLTQAIGELAAGGQESFNALAEQLGASANASGQFTVQGLVEGLNAAESEAEAEGRQLGIVTIDAVNSGLGVASPSTKTRTSGQNTGQGLINGLVATKGRVRQTATELGTTAVSAIQTGLRQPQWRTLGSVAGNSLASGVAASRGRAAESSRAVGSSAFAAARSGIDPGAWAAAGSNAANSMAAGILSGRSAVIAASVDIAAASIAAAKDTLQIHSPSHVFGDMGENATSSYADSMLAGRDKIMTATRAALDMRGVSAQIRGASPAAATGRGDSYGAMMAAMTEALRRSGLGIWIDGREYGRMNRDLGVQYG